MTQNDAGDILKFRNDSNMPKTRRTALFRLVSQYLRTHYGNVPSREAKEAMERALSDIFPWMKSNENGTVRGMVITILHICIYIYKYIYTLYVLIYIYIYIRYMQSFILG